MAWLLPNALRDTTARSTGDQRRRVWSSSSKMRPSLQVDVLQYAPDQARAEPRSETEAKE
ncbi:hypothetical protein CERZMDRAFT_90137 [Cercospora zeae-maydis SCOH1-5]|uniref:Uncharacterized protein n=1 Tax=Cercospora zeae-maydis SCOH1-5 TaxID=717836 RepID=A0A6A6FPT8_9PEZI|nr:hypothetical protein CERZMDRAFT_90137 [Cercospora zeae-maydis SCOH1-5]